MKFTVQPPPPLWTLCDRTSYCFLEKPPTTLSCHLFCSSTVSHGRQVQTPEEAKNPARVEPAAAVPACPPIAVAHVTYKAPSRWPAHIRQRPPLSQRLLLAHC